MKQAVVVVGYENYGYASSLGPLLRKRGYTAILISNNTTEIMLSAYDEVFYCENPFSLAAVDSQFQLIKKKFDVVSVICQVDRLQFMFAKLIEEHGLFDRTYVHGIYNTKIKYLMRRIFRNAGLSRVQFYLIRNETDLHEASRAIQFPAVLKPIGGWGSYYVYKVGCKDELLQKYRWIKEKMTNSDIDASVFDVEWEGQSLNARRDFLLEEYIRGNEFTVDGFVDENEVQVVTIHQKIDSFEENCFRDTFYLTPPHNVSKQVVQNICGYVEQIVKTVGLRSSLFHIELRVDSNGNIEVIEINPRIGGGSIRNNIINLLGIDLLEILVDIQMENKTKKLSLNSAGVAFGFGVVLNKNGRIKNIEKIEFVKALPQVRQMQIVYPVGSVVSLADEEIYAAIICCLCKDFDEAISTKRLIMDSVKVEMEE